jgi:hypothetical protein
MDREPESLHGSGEAQIWKGVMSLERYKQTVASDFDKLMNDKVKKRGGNYTATDNAVLIRYQVQC